MRRASRRSLAPTRNHLWGLCGVCVSRAADRESIASWRQFSLVERAFAMCLSSISVSGRGKGQRQLGVERRSEVRMELGYVFAAVQAPGIG